MSHDLSNRHFAILIAAAIALAFVVRLGFILAADFPLHDGGLFFQMTRDLQAAGYRLPETTSYNGDGIPFAYPPLAMYLAGLLDDVTPMRLTTVFMVVPLVATTLMVGAFFLVANQTMRSRLTVVVAVFAFGMLPRTFLWMIMGGGITRSLGLMFALLMLHSVQSMYMGRDVRWAASASVFAALAVLSHLEMAWFAAFSAALFFAFYGRHRAGVIGSAIVCAATLVLTAPWWGTIVAQHGLSPFIAANSGSNAGMSNPIIGFIQYRFTSEPLFTMLAALALLGIVVELARRAWLVPAWLLATLVLDQRAFGTVAAVPLSMLVAIAVVDAVIPAARGVLGNATERPAPRWLMPAAVAAMAIYAALSAMLAGPLLLAPTSDAEQQAMAWPAANTPPSSRFLVISGDRWFADRTSEWFPVLSQRQSVATTQGYEWVQGGVFAERMKAYNAAQECAQKDAACLSDWSRDSGVELRLRLYPEARAARIPLRARRERVLRGASGGAPIRSRIPRRVRQRGRDHLPATGLTPATDCSRRSGHRPGARRGRRTPRNAAPSHPDADLCR